MEYLKKLKQAHYIFALIALTFGLYFVSAIPPLWGLDEPSHFYRVYQIAHGQFIPRMNRESRVGTVPLDLYNLGNYSIGDLVDNDTHSIIARKDVDSVDAYKKYTHSPFSTKQHIAPSTSSYSPVAYIAPTIGVVVANILHLNIGQTIWVARAFSLIFYIFIVAYALKIIGDFKVRWIVFLVALVPAALFQASVVTADGATIALSLLFVALLLKLTAIQEVKQIKTILAVVGVTAILLPLVKLNYILLSAGVILIPSTRFSAKRIALFYKGTILIIATTLTAIWATISKVTATQVSQRPDGVPIVISDQIAFTLTHPFNFVSICARTLVVNSDAYLTQMFTMVGWNYITPPFVYAVILVLIIFMAALYGGHELVPIRKKLMVLTLFVAAGIVSIFFTLYVAFTPYKSLIVEGVQGRYFIPFLVPVLLFVASIMPATLNIKEKAAPYIFIVPSVCCLLATAIYYNLATY